MTAPVDPSNAEIAKGWDGPLGAFWADNVDGTDAQVAAYLPTFLDAVGVAPDARVLDVGCGAGRTSREIARLLVISVKTVERHRANLLQKLGLRDRLDLTRYAIRTGLTEP